jgi:hypothetical protein
VNELDFLIGQTVERFHYPANGIRVVFKHESDRAEPDLYVDLESTFTYTDSAGTVHVVDDDLSALGAVFSLAGEKVEGVSVADGVLRLEFSRGRSIRCEPDPAVEAWQVVGGDPLGLVVCTTEGELLIADARTPETTFEELDRLQADFQRRQKSEPPHG